jgi:hypothetical protein
LYVATLHEALRQQYGIGQPKIPKRPPAGELEAE